MNRRQIAQYLRLLGQELQKDGRTGEIVVVGGAVMLLKIQSRASTQDVDVYFLKEGPAIQPPLRSSPSKKGCQDIGSMMP